MNRKLILPVMAMSIVLVFTACSKAIVPDETSSATTSEIATQTTTEDTTTETTEIAKTRRVPLDHTFNPHCLSGIYIDKYGKEFEENYYRYCDAVLAGEESVKLDKDEYLQMSWYISRYCLPIVSQYVCFPGDGVGANKIGEGEYKIEYDAPIDEYLNAVEQFKERVEFLIGSACLEDDTPLEKTIALYKSETYRLDYDTAATEEDFEDAYGYNVSPYRALMLNRGICQEIAGAYAYLLLQVGVDATTCGGLKKDISSAHEWTVVKIDDKYYHCDVTYQCCTDKYTLQYFGMTDDQREIEGDWLMEKLNFGALNDTWHKDLPIEDTRFEKVWTCTAYDLDRDENMLYCYRVNGADDIGQRFEMSVA